MVYWKAQGLSDADIDRLREAVLDKWIGIRLGTLKLV
jgi:hypothetical protein